MESILLMLVPAAAFLLGFLVIRRAGRFLDENYRGAYPPDTAERKVCIIETEEKEEEDAEEICAAVSAHFRQDEYDLVICKSADPRVISFLKQTGYVIKYDLRQ